jgi:hypothetical protein
MYTYINSATVSHLAANAPARVAIASNAIGGIDTTLTGTAWVAFKFVMSGTSMNEVGLSIKRDVATSTAQIELYLYSDSAGVPGANISSTVSGQPHTYYYSGFSTGYVTLYFKQPQTTLVNGTSYWAVIKGTGIAGGNINFDSHAFGSNRVASAADSGGVPGSWTGVGREGVFAIYPNTGDVVRVESNNEVALFGNTWTGDAIKGESITGLGGRFSSAYNIGLGGFSSEHIGNKGASVNGIGMQAITTAGPAAGQFWGQGAVSIGAQNISQTFFAVQNLSYVGAFIQNYDPNSGSAEAVTCITEEITLSTVATTTNSTSSVILPANSLIKAVAWRVTQTITTAATVTIGDASSAVRFATLSGLTAGTTGIGLNHMKGGVATDANGPAQVADSAIRITCNVNPGAGKIRVIVWSSTFAVPAF